MYKQILCIYIFVLGLTNLLLPQTIDTITIKTFAKENPNRINMKKKIAVVLVTLIVLLLVGDYIASIRVNRTEDNAIKLAYSKVEEWQKYLRGNIPCDTEFISNLFTTDDEVEEIELYEKKIRQFYKISSTCKTSALGELMRLHKDLYLIDLDPNAFFTELYLLKTKGYYYMVSAAIIPISLNKNKDYVYIKFNTQNKINIQQSYIRGKSFASILGIDSNGRIIDSNIEKKLLKLFQTDKHSVLLK